MKRGLVVVVLLLAAGLAVSAEPGVDEPTSVQQSRCYDCHDVGGAGLGPPMTEVFRISPAGSLSVDVGETVDLEVAIRNWWVAAMGPFAGVMDLSEAPAFSFADEVPDVLNQGQSGNLPFVASAVLEPERSQRLTIDVPLGGTDFELRLAPGRTEGDQAPDLYMRIWDPFQNPDQATPRTVNNGGRGEGETFLFSANPVTDGEWTVDVVHAGTVASPFALDQSQLVAQPFEVSWDLLYDYTDPIRYAEADVILDGQEPETPQVTDMTWSIRLDNAISQPQRIRVTVDANGFYDHPPQFQAEDDWLFRQERIIEIMPPSQGGDNSTAPPIIIGGEDEPDGPDLAAEFGTPMSTWGEIVGYAAGFLMLLSLVTGGGFGNWSKRLQHWVPFRRAKRRIAFHNLVSYALLVVALVHMVLFLVEPRFPWSLGFFLGTVSLLGMILAGVTGAFQMGMIRTMGYEGWRWMHYLTFVVAFGAAAAHIALDGIHFTEFQEAVRWEDPAIPWLDSVVPPATSID